MTTTRVENIPVSWDEDRDLPFFRITTALFPPDFCLGAGVLLASYDDDTAEVVTGRPQPRDGSPLPATNVMPHAAPAQQPLAVRVHRTR